MRTPKHSRSGFTLIELLVVIAIIAIMAAISVPQIAEALKRAQMAKTSNNAQAIAKIWGGIVVANTSVLDPKVGWPGDLYASDTDAKISNVKDFYQRFLDYSSKSNAQELASLLVTPGMQRWTPTDQSLSRLDADKMNPFKIYLVRDNDPANTVFIATKNYQYNKELTANSPAPYSDAGFILIQKFGNGQAFQKQQAKTPALLGLLPNRKDLTDNPTETAADFLSDN